MFFTQHGFCKQNCLQNYQNPVLETSDTYSFVKQSLSVIQTYVHINVIIPDNFIKQIISSGWLSIKAVALSVYVGVLTVKFLCYMFP